MWKMHIKPYKIDPPFISSLGNMALFFFKVKLPYFILPQQFSNSAEKSQKSKQENSQEAGRPQNFHIFF